MVITMIMIIALLMPKAVFAKEPEVASIIAQICGVCGEGQVYSNR